MHYKNIEIKYGGHSGFLLKGNGMNIYIDPFKLGDINESDKADIVLISHSHYDHCSVEDIRKIIKYKTKIIGCADILSQTRQIKDGIDFEISEPGKYFEIHGVKITCFPAYNINKPYHPKDENWVSFLIEINGTRIYHAGDSDLIPEMNSIKTDVALIPISGKFVMDVNEAVRAVEIIKPDLAIPMHYGVIIGQRSDADKFVELCKEKGINAMILEKEI